MNGVCTYLLLLDTNMYHMESSMGYKAIPHRNYRSDPFSGVSHVVRHDLITKRKKKKRTERFLDSATRGWVGTV